MPSMDEQYLIADGSSHNLSRRQFLTGAGSFLLTTGALGLVGCKSGPKADVAGGVPVSVPRDPDLGAGGNRPNFVFILTDDHRWDHLSVMGHPFLETPNIDRLANEGVLFENAFVTTSLCSPSRASFLTGKYARNHGVQNNLTPWDDHSVTFMEILAKAGYRNAFIGKWHMPGRLPNLRGVEQFITFTVQAGQGRYFDCPLIMNGETVERPGTYITEDLTDLAIEFIHDQGEQPFCLYLSHKAAHHQFLPPRDLDDLYSDVDISFLPEEYFSLQTMLDRNIWEGALGFMENHYRNYNETLVGVDRELGRLIETLESRGLMDNTVIIYAGDNGYSWGEHVLVGKRWASEENLRIPFIIRFPERLGITPKHHDGYVLNVDLAPTILDLAGLSALGGMDGQSVLSLVGDARTAWRDAFVYEYFQDFPYNVPAHKALRTDQFLYVEYDRGKEPELFDVTTDFRTLDNIINTPTGRAALPGLRQKLQLEEVKLG
jgi:N-acetylglucosamine-6-sulfatase